jgi:hypothetical protein
MTGTEGDALQEAPLEYLQSLRNQGVLAAVRYSSGEHRCSLHPEYDLNPRRSHKRRSAKPIPAL